jgi:ADP-ribosylglycohydrolase
MPHKLEHEMRYPPQSTDDEISNRIQGSMMGMAIGDALGAHVEFQSHEYLVAHRVVDLESGGTWNLSKGQVISFI